MTPYIERIQLHSGRVAEWKKKSASISFFRLAAILTALIFGWLGIKTGTTYYWIVVAAGIAGFIILMRVHESVRKQLKLAETLVQINQVEIGFLENNRKPFDDGARFQEAHHPYTFDLDIFGPHSLYHHLNRTKTAMGGTFLAETLKKRQETRLIADRQDAVRELTPLLDWRQHFSAKAQLANDSDQVVSKLISWTDDTGKSASGLRIIRFVLPALLLSLVISFAFTRQVLFLHFSVTVFIINLVVLASQLKRMNAEISDADKINETILRYSELLNNVETASWESPLLQSLQAQLVTSGKTASEHIHQLSRIFAALESLQNGFGAIIFNGTVLYHLHSYHRLLHWKSKHAHSLRKWLEIIAELEVLLSFANLGYNNPTFSYPVLNDEHLLEFEELGHPLISASKRVANSVDFTEKSFIILTGSNMSGKSTFLRTLGINFILANAGASVCAKRAVFHPMDVLVSMRLSDSLTDSESYFYAEVKRLKEIMDELENRQCFILLDEILRGTNSDDKRTGTIEVVKKVIAKKAFGAIATHDLEVCNITPDHPGLVNNCFEVEIINNDLHFDYRLRAGICQNKSATFLMKKMGVI